MLIAQISDTHIPVPGRKTYGIAPMAENLAQCVDHLNLLDPGPDIVLVTGDITNIGSFEEFEHASKLLGELKMPYYVIPGNHDDRLALWATFGGKACPTRSAGFIQYVIELDELRLIAMDSTVPGEPGGELCTTRTAWLDDRLAEDPDKPSIIFMHHPPVKFGVIETDIEGFIGAQRLGDVVEKYSCIEAIICGHVHTVAHTRWHGTVVSTAPSMGMQLVLDLTMKRNEFVLETPAYQLHYWTRHHQLVTHTAYLHASDGPYLFKELSKQNKPKTKG